MANQRDWLLMQFAPHQNSSVKIVPLGVHRRHNRETRSPRSILAPEFRRQTPGVTCLDIEQIFDRSIWCCVSY